MLIGSSNKAAETIANGLIPRSSFMSLMNFNARRLGLTQTYFRNPTGLTEALPGQKTALTGTSTEGRLDIAGGVSTAREFAKLMWSVIAENPGLLDATHQDSIMVPNMNNKNKNIVTEFKVDNTNKLLKDYPIRFGKTGFTDNAGGNLAVVLQRSETSHPYVIVVLGSTLEHRFEDVAKLASTTLMLYTK
jgi:D-alanyl-D-alanine carboxypeptidase (penicillin-binding protein 5/6)